MTQLSKNPPFFLPMAKYIVEINRQTLLKQIGESVCNKGKSTLCSRKQSTLHTFSFCALQSCSFAPLAGAVSLTECDESS